LAYTIKNAQKLTIPAIKESLTFYINDKHVLPKFSFNLFGSFREIVKIYELT